MQVPQFDGLSCAIANQFIEWVVNELKLLCLNSMPMNEQFLHFAPHTVGGGTMV